MSDTKLTASWLALHDPTLHVGDNGIHDPAKDAALASALDPIPTVAFSGAVLTGDALANAEQHNAAARQALQEHGNTSPAFAAALANAPVTGLMMLTELARISAGFTPATSPPTAAQFNALTNSLGTLQLLFLISSVSLSKSITPYPSEDAAVNGVTKLLPIALPAPQRAALAALVAQQAKTAREEGEASERKLALYLFQITAEDTTGFSLCGSTWGVGATYKNPKKSKLEITVALSSGVAASFRWEDSKWREAISRLAPTLTSVSTLQGWVDGYSSRSVAPAPLSGGTGADAAG